MNLQVALSHSSDVGCVLNLVNYVLPGPDVAMYSVTWLRTPLPRYGFFGILVSSHSKSQEASRILSSARALDSQKRKEILLGGRAC